MNPNPINEFLPASAGPRLKGDTGGEDDFDLARFNAIRKEQKDELERLDRRHHDQQAAIDNQIQLEYDRLFQHFQQGMQNFYASLRQTINTTVENQVNFRMQKERICEDHTTNKRDVEKRFHSEASRLVMSSTHAVRPSQPFPTVPSNVSRPAPLAASPVSLSLWPSSAMMALMIWLAHQWRPSSHLPASLLCGQYSPGPTAGDAKTRAWRLH